jgi:alpha-tubulin suppressor-like RCC1 family protein
LKTLKGIKLKSGVCGDVHTLVLSENGEVFSFGGGSFGQLGLGPISKMPLDSDNYPYMPVPTRIEALQDIFILSISCGDSHSMAVDKEGRLYAWGAAACGQLGLDNLVFLPKDGEGNPYEPEPKFVNFFENIKVLATACGENHSLVLVEGNVIYR